MEQAKAKRSATRPLRKRTKTKEENLKEKLWEDLWVFKAKNF